MAASLHDPTGRFGNRVHDYVRWRPGYPPALLAYLQERGYLCVSSVIADVGAGTGISTTLFLDAGCSVYAVEPNAAMRAAATRALGRRAGFHAIDGRAEATALDNASVDLIAAGTAFHWFEPRATRAEFERILRDDGHVALFWNLRASGSAFMSDYEAVLTEQCRGYAAANVARRADERSIDAFFGNALIDRASFAHVQHFDFNGLLGRVLSSSYAPKPGEPAYVPMRTALQTLFDTHAVDGRVTLTYTTRLHVGRLH